MTIEPEQERHGKRKAWIGFTAAGTFVAVLLGSPVVAGGMDWFRDWYQSAPVEPVKPVDVATAAAKPVVANGAGGPANEDNQQDRSPIDYGKFPPLRDRPLWNVRLFSCGDTSKHAAILTVIEQIGFSQVADAPINFKEVDDIFQRPGDFSLTSRVLYYSQANRPIAVEFARMLTTSSPRPGNFVALPGDTDFGQSGGESKLIVHAVLPGCER